MLWTLISMVPSQLSDLDVKMFMFKQFICHRNMAINMCTRLRLCSSHCVHHNSYWLPVSKMPSNSFTQWWPSHFIRQEESTNIKFIDWFSRALTNWHPCFDITILHSQMVLFFNHTHEYIHCKYVLDHPFPSPHIPL